MKKKISLILSMLLLAFSVVGCSKDNVTDNTNNSQEKESLLLLQQQQVYKIAWMIS